MNEIISIKNVTKQYKTKGEYITAVDNLNLSIKKHEVFGLIGPTGAGKTTVIKMLSTLIIPDKGSITIDGYDVVREGNKIKRILGVLAGEFTRSLYWRLTGRQNLEFFAKLKNIWHPQERIDYLTELFDLKKWENKLVMRYSTGMKHKLAFAIALLNDPPILLLDEPLTGVDPITSYEIKKLIREDFREKTIMWASHNLYEIEEMCSRIGLLNHGKLVLEGSVEALKKKYWSYERILLIVDRPQIFLEIDGAKITGKNRVEIKTDDVTATLKKIVDICIQNTVNIEEIKTVKPTLEEVFIAGVKK
ncbi:MAG: ABC transporter ATP-binding protein [Thermoplasmata archaeon]|nr:MAG: ABC transporter ATP-binding protein [Thermoplasmata archaeon]